MDVGAPSVGFFAGVGEHLREFTFTVGGGVGSGGEDVGNIAEIAGFFEAVGEGVTFLSEFFDFVLEFGIGGFELAEFVSEFVEGAFMLLLEGFFASGEFTLELFAFFGDGVGDELAGCWGRRLSAGRFLCRSGGCLFGGEGTDVGKPTLRELFHAWIFGDLEILFVPFDGVFVIAGAFVDAGEVEVGVLEIRIELDGAAEVLESSLCLVIVFELECLLVNTFGA